MFLPSDRKVKGGSKVPGLGNCHRGGDGRRSSNNRNREHRNHTGHQITRKIHIVKRNYGGMSRKIQFLNFK